MICVNSLHLRFNRILMLLVGIWPYERSILVRLQLFLFYGILTTFIIFQFTTFTTSKCTPQCLIDVSSIVIFFIFLMIKFNMFCFNMDAVRYLFEALQQIYDGLRDDNEVTIIKKYGIAAEQITLMLMACAIFFKSAMILFQIGPRILNILWSTNDSDIQLITQNTEYFIDQEKYFYLIMLHANVATFIGGFALLAGGTMIIMCFQYTCGMFEIAGYRIEQAMKIDILPMYDKRNRNLFYEKLIYALDIHRKAMWFIQLLMSKLNLPYLLLTAFGIVSLSLNLFRVFQEVSSGHITLRLIPSVIIVIILLFYMYLSNDCAQRLMDHDDNLFSTVYNVPWYIAPVYIQKIILFLLQKGSKPYVINIGGLYVASLKNAASVMSASISYFAVLCSVR